MSKIPMRMITVTAEDGSSEISLEKYINSVIEQSNANLGRFILQSGTQYKQGDRVFDKSLGSNYILTCVKSGTTTSSSYTSDYKDIEKIILARDTNYDKGNKVFSKEVGAGYLLTCTKSGTTSKTVPKELNDFYNDN